jgi:pimeloyl-ACP methyl ester carboxylesterase
VTGATSFGLHCRVSASLDGRQCSSLKIAELLKPSVILKAILRTVALVLLVAFGLGVVRADEPADRLRAEMQQRNNALIEQGFNLTNRFTLGVDSKVLHVDLLIPSSRESHELKFWAHAVGGDVAFKVTSADGHVLALWDGQSGEKSFSLALPVGRIRVEVEGSRADSVFGVFGVKGPILRTCEVDLQRVTTHSANVGAGFRWPYLLYLPKHRGGSFLLAAPNNTGFVTSNPGFLAADGMCAIKRNTDLAERLGTPLLVPLFPRPSETLYLHALSRASLTTKTPAYARVDLQFAKMLDDAQRVLGVEGTKVSQRVLLTGFSASGSFVSRFAMLHPDRVSAVAAGSPGGWPIVPAARDGDAALPYPVGIADVKSLTGTAPDLSFLRQVAWFFFMGDADTNDSVPHRDSFSKADETLITHHFSATPLARWKDAERLYLANGMNAQFKIYPGASHAVSADMQRDVEAFFVEVMK